MSQGHLLYLHHTCPVVFISIYTETIEDTKMTTEAVNRTTDNSMDKRTNNDLQNNIQKLQTEKHQYTKTGDGLRCSGRGSTSCSTSTTRHITFVTNPVIIHDGERKTFEMVTSA